MSYVLRVARPEDAAALLEIYAPYVTDTAITFEYDIPSTEEFAGRIAQTLARYPYLVAEDSQGQALGYAYAGVFHARPASDWAVEPSIYVRREGRRQGVGRALYAALEQALAAQGILNLNACIAYPETEDEHLNKDSVRFHTHLGYRMVGEFYQCGYKFDRWYNMVWMEKHIGAHSSNPAKVIWFSEL